MTNQTVLLIYLPFVLAAAVLWIATFQADSHSNLVRYGLTFYGNLLGWLACEILFFVLRSERAIHFFYALQITFIAFLPISLLMAIAGFYRVQQRLPRRRLTLLSLVPTLTGILAVTSLWHPLIFRHFEIDLWTPLTTPSYAWGPWFYVHIAYSLGLLVYVCQIIAQSRARTGRAKQPGFGLLVTSVGLCIAATLLEPLRILLSAVDVSLVLMSLAGVLLYAATLSAGYTDYLQVERKELLDYLDESVFILDKDDRIIDCNESAARFLKLMGVEQPEESPFDDMLGELRAKGRIGQRTHRAEGGEGEDLYIVDARFLMVLQMTRQGLAARGGHTEGAFVILDDVTQNRLLIERLQAMSGVDPLTGLANKYQYRIQMRTLDTAENLPISVLVCDLQGLHQINASVGRTRGDEIIRTVADALTAHRPEGGLVARMSGDQFVLLMPRYSNEAARVTIADIQLWLMQQRLFQGEVEMRWGFATKTRPEENLNALRIQAEQSAARDPANRTEGGEDG